LAKQRTDRPIQKGYHPSPEVRAKIAEGTRMSYVLGTRKSKKHGPEEVAEQARAERTLEIVRQQLEIIRKLLDRNQKQNQNHSQSRRKR
jgi:hypothetical protein